MLQWITLWFRKEEMRVEKERKNEKRKEKEIKTERERLSLLQPLKAEKEQVDKSMT